MGAVLAFVLLVIAIGEQSEDVLMQLAPRGRALLNVVPLVSCWSRAPWSPPCPGLG